MTYSPSSAASASMASCLRTQVSAASLMLSSKCLATLCRLMILPTPTPILSWHVSRPVSARIYRAPSSASVACSRLSRLCARSLASASLWQATRRSPGYSGEVISARLR